MLDTARKGYLSYRLFLVLQNICLSAVR